MEQTKPRSSDPASKQTSGEITITFPDGASRNFPKGVTGYEIAESISKSLAKASIAVKLNGVQKDLSDPVHEDTRIEIIKLESSEGLEIMRHTVTAQLLAKAVKNLYPKARLAIGPTIENGFYYDIDFPDPVSEEALPDIEKEMRRIQQSHASIIKKLYTKKEAIEAFQKRGEDYKVDIIENTDQEEGFQIYHQGDTGFIDLCHGPHVPNLKHIGVFKLMSVAGAYWRGDSSNKMLTRIYGTAWASEKELKNYLQMLEEAEKRDHRKLGREMGLFHFQEEAMGSVFWHPKGYRIWVALEQYIRKRLAGAGYEEVKTPQLIDNKLWEKSGHWGKFRENMFVVPDEVPATDDNVRILSGEADLMALKPMNCPGHVQIFKQGTTSYKDLPIRMSEFGCCHRNEAHGALHGLLRVRQMTQDDAHIFCREDQIFDEIKAFLELFFAVYKDFGFQNFKVLLATRPENRGGEDALWDRSEKAMAEVLEALEIEFDVAEGEGAFYGPKYEFHLKDAIGRSWQVGTCQLDFVLPERLEARYVGEDGEKHNVVMIHRAIYGTLERFIGLLLESYGGKLPLWLAPVQCVVAPISDANASYAGKVMKELEQAGLRAELDVRNEKINYKIREHSVKKVPYIFVVGGREEEDQSVAIRELGGKDQKIKKLGQAVSELAKQAKAPY